MAPVSADNQFIRRTDQHQSPVLAKDFVFLHEAAEAKRILTPDEASEDALAIAQAIGACGQTFDRETQNALRRFRSKLNEKLVLDVLKLVNAPDLAIRFFLWAGGQIGYEHTSAAYNALLDVLCLGSKFRVPLDFLKEIEKVDRDVLGRLFNVLVRKCCRMGLWNEALEELGRLKDFGCRPSSKTYNALAQVFLSAGQLDSAFLVHKEMSGLGLFLDRFTMGQFAHALCREGRWAEALSIVENNDFTLDTVICTQMITGLLEASLFEEAVSFLHRMRSNSFVPNVVTYRMMLSGLLKQRQLGWCKRILSMMITEGCSPSYSLFNSLVHAFCISRDYAYAYKLLHKMVSCGCRPGYVTYNILIGGICGSESLPSPEVLELAEKAYEEMLVAEVVLNKVNVANLALCLCGAGKFDRAFVVIKEMMNKGFVPDTSTYTNVINVLCQACKVEQAFLLFNEMKDNGVTPDVYTYTILIDSFCKAGLIDQAHNWFDEMILHGCSPNVVTFTALIHAYLKARKFLVANELFDYMLSQGCLPNVVTYTALIDGLCKAGEIDKACQVYCRMKGSGEIIDGITHFESSNIEKVEPNVFTYGALVDGLCKVHKVVEARDLLDAMSDAGCEPNHVVYDALIDGFCKIGKLEEAQEVFIRMSQRGYSPDVYTYSILIDKLFKDKRLDLALKILSKMLQNSCVPNVVTYTEMIDGLCKVGKTDEAHKLFKMMEEKGCIPNAVTFTALIDGFGKAGRYDMCLEMFRQMTSKGCAPNFITYNVLINHCCGAGLLDEAITFLEEMKHTYWPRYVKGYHNVIQGFTRKFVISLGLLDEVSKNSLVPIAPAYTILIDNLSKAGRLDTALELHKEIVNMPCSAASSQNSYCSLIEGFCLASRVEKAFELYSEMIRRGHIPELYVLSSLIKGLFGEKKWEEALQLCYTVCHMDILWHIEEHFDGG